MMFETQNRQIFAEVLTHLPYDNVVSMCQVNKRVHMFARENCQKLLLQKNLEKLLIHHQTPELCLIHCCKSGSLKMVDYLLNLGVDPKCYYYLPLAHACIFRHTRIIERLFADPRLDPFERTTKLWTDHCFPQRSPVPKGAMSLPCTYSLLVNFNAKHVGLIYVSRTSPCNSQIILKFLNDPRVVAGQINPFDCPSFQNNLSNITDASLMKTLLSDVRFKPTLEFLISSASNDTAEIVDLLLNDSRIDPENDYEYRTLKNAAWNGNKEIIKRLLADERFCLPTRDIQIYQNYVDGNITHDQLMDYEQGQY